LQDLTLLLACDAATSGSALGVAALLALCSALLEKSLKGGMVVVGGLNLGGSIEPVFNASTLVEIAVEKGAAHVLMPISARTQLNDLPDDVLTKVTLFYYSDPRDALIKGLAE
jgi:ATP-dependent Lon protease